MVAKTATPVPYRPEISIDAIYAKIEAARPYLSSATIEALKTRTGLSRTIVLIGKYAADIDPCNTAGMALLGAAMNRFIGGQAGAITTNATTLFCGTPARMEAVA